MLLSFLPISFPLYRITAFDQVSFKRWRHEKEMLSRKNAERTEDQQ